jgi:BirA family biotin operon repressor/biotin-[acetyl-CoA-carboxylase] ligase
MDRPALDPALLRRGSDFWTRVDVVETTGSTNADLMAAAAADVADERRVLIAEHQQAGRGRRDRVWVSPPRAQLAMSVLLRLRGIAPGALGWLPLLTGVAVADALRDAAGVDAKLKWPNDVLIDGRKVSGILAEVVPGQADQPIGVVVGIGINVSLAEAELPVPHATSLALSGAPDTDRTALARAVLDQIAARYLAWNESGWATGDLADAYRERCATVGQPVRAELPGGEAVVGTAVGVDPDGRLQIRIDTGATVAVAAGDITHLRPA